MINTYNWHYNPDDRSASNDKMLAEGDYRVCISSVYPTVAKNGTEGLEITYDVNGHSNSLKHYIWLNRTNTGLVPFNKTRKIIAQKNGSWGTGFWRLSN